MSVWARWRETEIDHVDLDAGYTHSHWPAEFVDLMLPRVLPTLAARLPMRSPSRSAWKRHPSLPSRPGNQCRQRWRRAPYRHFRGFEQIVAKSVEAAPNGGSSRACHPSLDHAL